MGARVVVDADIREAKAALQELIGKLDEDGTNTLLDEIGQYVVSSTRERASREVGPDGAAWAALTPRYLVRKQKKRPAAGILRFNNHMLGDQLSAQLDGDSVLVGTNAIYGGAHQFGYGGIPARPWLGFSSDDEEGILGITQEHLGLLQPRGQ